MLAHALVAVLAATEPSASPAPPPPPAPTSAEAVVAAAFAERSAPASPGAPGPSPSSMAVPAAALAVLAIAALVLARRRPKASRLVQVLEVASLGPKRSLIVAEHGGQQLLLGASEAGITLLLSRPSPEPQPLVAPQPVPPPVGDSSPLRSILDRFGGKKAPAPAFEELLAESAEDQELRAKLAAGLKGRVK